MNTLSGLAMTQDYFERYGSTITKDVRQILQIKGDDRRQRRLLAVYEKEHNDLLAEIFKTVHGPVVVFTDAEHGGISQRVTDIGGHGHIAPLTNDEGQRFLMKGRSRSYVVTRRNLEDRTHPYLKGRREH